MRKGGGSATRSSDESQSWPSPRMPASSRSIASPLWPRWRRSMDEVLDRVLCAGRVLVSVDVMQVKGQARRPPGRWRASPSLLCLSELEAV